MGAKLKLIDKIDEPKDITMLLRKDIEARDWDRVHIECARREPLFIPDRVRRIWRG